MDKFKIKQQDNNMRLNEFLLDEYEDWKKSDVNKLLKKGLIKVNDKKKDFNYRLRSGDILVIYEEGEEQIVSNPKPVDLWFLDYPHYLDIMFEDDNFIVVNKSIGLMSHPSKEIGDSVQTRLLHHLYNKKQYDPYNQEGFVPSICHRLDRNTSGLLICAKNKQSLTLINKAMSNHEVVKNYRCLVYGKMPKEADILSAYHFRNSIDKYVHISTKPIDKYVNIITEYKVLWNDEKYSLLDINLITGRTHQIRAHMNFIGRPIVGEKKYTNPNIKRERAIPTQALVCNKLTFNIKENSPIAYLNKKSFVVKDIWFEYELNKPSNI
ncbi:MAG: RluA family pseudouridine synthase [Mycoplasma sp.]